MGTFSWPMTVANIDGNPSRDLEAIVDTGAAYTTLPSSLVHALGVRPKAKRTFLLADGRQVEMDYGEARVTIDGEDVTTLVVFGEEDNPAILGAYTLEGLGLAVDPVNQRLIPTTMILCQAAA